jgi:superfamily II DNA or RNA helicase
MPRKLRNKSFSFREWQKECFDKALEYYFDDKKDFLAVATPGSGKTKLGLALAYYFLSHDLCDRVVVNTPTDNLKRQWAEDAAYFAQIDLDPDFSNAQRIETSDFHGVVLTYALLGMDKDFNQAVNTVNKRTLVIFDEVHHAGETLTWGDAIKTCFENAVFRISLSGTAFRSDDCKIPFITYDENGVSVADYTYGYDRAIKDNVCRPVYFRVFEGSMRWKVDKAEFEHSFADTITTDQVSKRLKTALDTKGMWIRDVISAAANKLTELRQEHPEAACLITCATQKHAKETAEIVQELTGITPPVIISDEGEGAKKIKAFRKSKEPFLVSVKMVSEGTDIPRLRIAVYLTIIKTELYFRQLTGRVVRVIQDLGGQDAYVFIPADRDIVKFAEKIQEEREHALDQVEKKVRNKSDETNKDLFGNDYTPALQGKFQPLESMVTDSNMISIAIGLAGDIKKPSAGTKYTPNFLERERLKERLNSLAKTIARNKHPQNPDWKYAHNVWIKEKGGKEMDIETIEELKARLKFYEYLKGLK